VWPFPAAVSVSEADTARRGIKQPSASLGLHFGLLRARIIYSSRARSSRFVTRNDCTKELFGVEK
jgi:hypothetical protein